MKSSARVLLSLTSVILIVLIIALITAASAAYIVNARTVEPFRGYATEEAFVDVPSGTGTLDIGGRLVQAGVIRDTLTYRAALWLSGDARRLKAGEYRFDRPMSAREVIAKIARGDVYLVSITFREGLTMAEMAALAEEHAFGAAGTFLEAARDVALIQALDPGARDLEGYLFPDTYAVPRRTDAPQLVRLMVERFQHVLTPDLRDAATAQGLTIRQLVTLASLVEKETAQAGERALVAAVFTNRLRLRMGLQCDPTVIYALSRAGRFTGNLRKDDLTFDSPYNTYRYAGLPPGPIASPGKASLEAAAHPADVDFLYFVSRNDGSHQFARTLDEHNRNVQRFQVQYFRARR